MCSISTDYFQASRCDDGADYPFVAAERSLPEVPKRNVSRIRVDLPSTKWQWDKYSLTLPFDVSRLDDVCVASSPVKSGILYLDSTQGKPSVTFTDLRNPGAVSNWFNLPILPSPCSIATVLDRDGFSNVLIAGDGGILHVPAQDWVNSVPLGTTLPPTLKDDALNAARELRVAQHDKTITVWVINGSGNIVGQAARLEPRIGEDEVDDLVSVGSTVPLLSATDTIRHFRAIVDQTSKQQSLYVLKTGGSVSCLQQAGDSKLWTEAELKIPDLEDVQNVNTYTCQVHCRNAQEMPMPHTDVKISTSSQVRGAVNGEITYLSQSPVFVKTDERGDLTIILPANDLATPTVTITGAGVLTVFFHPADKAIAKLATNAKNGGLQNARGANGQPLVPKADATSLQIIGELHNTFKSHQTSGSVSVDSQGLMQAQAAGADWSFWHGLVAGVEKLASFAYEGGQFIVRTAKALWSFIVETAEQALKAISAVLNWIGGVIEDVMEWLAEQLDWESILDVQTFLGEFTLTGIDCVQELIVMGAEKLDEWLTDGEEEVMKWRLSAKLPDSFAKQTLQTDKNKDKDKTKGLDNPCCKWVDSKLQDKRLRKSMEGKQTGSEEDATLEKVLTTFYLEFLKPLWASLVDTSGHVWDDLKELFDSNSSVTGAEVFKNIGVDILLGIIRVARTSVNGLVAVIIQLVKWIKSVLDTKLEIWCLTKVYRKVTKGVNLTILNLATLVLAVPGAYLFKMVTGKKPREVPAIRELLKKCRPLSGLTQKLSAAQFSLMTTSFVTLPSTQAHLNQNQNQKEEHAAKTVNDTIKKSANLSKFTELMRLGSMFIAIGMAVWTPYDCISTCLCWPTASTSAGFPTTWVASVWMRFKPVVSFVAWIVCTAADMPLKQTTLKRTKEGVAARWSFWAVKGYFNFVKLTTPELAKPHLAGMIGLLDMAGYLAVVITESDGEETDTVLEVLSRLLGDGWAMGSWYNCTTKGGEPYGLAATLAAGNVMTNGNIVKAIQHCKYWDKHSDDEDYNPPTWSNSLGGSLF